MGDLSVSQNSAGWDIDGFDEDDSYVDLELTKAELGMPPEAEPATMVLDYTFFENNWPDACVELFGVVLDREGDTAQSTTQQPSTVSASSSVSERQELETGTETDGPLYSTNMTIEYVPDARPWGYLRFVDSRRLASVRKSRRNMMLLPDMFDENGLLADEGWDIVFQIWRIRARLRGTKTFLEVLWHPMHGRTEAIMNYEGTRNKPDLDKLWRATKLIRSGVIPGRPPGGSFGNPAELRELLLTATATVSRERGSVTEELLADHFETKPALAGLDVSAVRRLIRRAGLTWEELRNL